MDALSNIVIETAQGKVKGVEEHDGIVVFRGIPYAAPPVGENRWKEAKPHEKWEGVLDCSSFGNSAPQNMMDEISQLIWTEEFQISNRTYSEDCLTLNLWTKAGLRDMPVVVYFYGGGYVSGGSSCEIYDGTVLSEAGIVYVTFNHREGTLALFAGEELSEKSESGTSGNYLLSDDIAALRWVKENIRAFGGDPDNVTIWGQSSGAGQVNALSISPLAKGLFSKVISMGYNDYVDFLFSKAWMEQKEAYAFGKELLQKMGCSLEEAYEKDFHEFLKYPQFGTLQIDGRYIESDFRHGVQNGLTDGIPFMMGSVPGDAVVMPFLRPAMACEEKKALEEILSGFFGPENTKEIWKAYEIENRENPEVLAEMKEDLLVGAMLDFALGRKERECGGLTYIYYFRHPMPGPNQTRFGAFHSCEVPYFMNHFSALRDAYWKEEDFALGALSSRELIHFIKTGKPAGDAFLPSDGTNYYSIDAAEQKNLLLDPRKRDLWFEIFKGGVR